ncbi:MAG: prolyl oligopeptidase family serine peptidase [Arenicellales bacterium]|nr:prolyl oligopeptidase family serine peptidase [Arenicellales bacterium]
MHGKRLVDNYAYFRNYQDESVQAYIKAEQVYAQRMMAPLDDIRETLVDEMYARTKQDDQSVPQFYAGYWYYSRWEEGMDYPLHCRRLRSMQASEQVYLDENELAGNRTYFDLASLDICPRQRYVAYAVDYDGSERYEIHIIDIQSGSKLADVINDASDYFTWFEDQKHIAYVRLDTHERPHAVYIHRLGEPVNHDRCVFVEHDPAFYVAVWKSRSKDYIFIESNSNTTSEVLFLSTHHPESTPTLVEKRNQGVEYYLDHQEGRFLILTNEEAANFKLMVTPVTDVGKDNWRILIPERKDTVLCSIDPYESFIVVTELFDGLDRVGVLQTTFERIDYLDFQESVASLYTEGVSDYRSTFVRIVFGSLNIPEETWDYCVRDQTWTLRKREEIAGFDRESYVCERLSVAVKDGVRIPLTLVFQKATRKVQNPPVLLHAYGAYGEPLDIDFDSDLLSLLDRGVIVAYAHVRGGGEYGQYWHLSGSMLNKENSIQDYIDCAQSLIDRGVTQAGSIAGLSGSAGGLTVAVAAQRAPQLFSAVVVEAPFVDVIHTLLDKSLPISAHDIEEFGDPEREEQFAYMKRYSPYDNVSEKYPPLLVTAGLNDQRVGYWEPLKWVASIRTRKTDQNPVILKIDEVGHAGGSGRHQELQDTAHIYAFLLATWGLESVKFKGQESKI